MLNIANHVMLGHYGRAIVVFTEMPHYTFVQIIFISTIE